jgi:band 7 protein
MAQQEGEAMKIKAQADSESIKLKAQAEAESIKLKALAEAQSKREIGLAEAEAIKAKALAEAEGIDKKADAMKKYGNAAIMEMYFKALPEISKNVAAPLNNIDKITMYGDGNTSKLVGDITKSIAQINDGITDSTGIDLKSVLAGMLGGKIISDKEKLDSETKDNINSEKNKK